MTEIQMHLIKNKQRNDGILQEKVCGSSCTDIAQLAVFCSML